MQNQSNDSNRRRYIRLDSVFPVQFQLIDLDGAAASDWMQGFTHNVGKGGLQLEIHLVSAQSMALIQNRKVRVRVKIAMPLARPMIDADAAIVWSDLRSENSIQVGLAYENIARHHQARLVRYAIVKKVAMPVALSVIGLLAVGMAVNTYLNIQLIEGNKQLVAQLISILRESTAAKQKIKDINRDKEDAQLKIQALQLRIQTVDQERIALEEKTKLAEIAKSSTEERARSENAQAQERIKTLNDMIDRLTREKAAYQDQLIGLQHKENTVTEELLRLSQKKTAIEKANFDKMYTWLVVHQNPRTGLVMSFEGDKDVQDWAFIYDQALVIQAYLHFSDFERARKMLEFFAKKAKRADGFFVNAYYVNDGGPGEFIVHSGPNIWLGIATVQYIQKTRDTRYMPLAEDIAKAIMGLQSQDADGGIRGGPQVTWYATEHNLDAYAFFSMLYKLTGKNMYLDARDKVLAWLLLHTYDKQEVPIKRGKGDSTIATDTYAWSIAALGPEKLEELGLNPEKIMEFAENNCAVTVNYDPGGGVAVRVKGFDFAPAQHVARGGVISTEWTAQMIISFRMMADYYRKKNIPSKAAGYEQKADEYLADLCNLIITSPSPTGQGSGCLPYASVDFVDTGHGWMTPKGKTTGSVSGTAYTIFAYYNVNPLQLHEESKTIITQKTP
jgi:hypothetical protein